VGELKMVAVLLW